MSCFFHPAPQVVHLRVESTNNRAIHGSTFDLPTGESYFFTATTIAGAEGTVALIGAVSQNGTSLVEVTDLYEVAGPQLSVVLTAPDVVGRDPFELGIEIRNTAKFDFSGQLTVTGGQGEIDRRSISLPAGETKLLQYGQQIGQTTTYTVEIAGEAAQTATKTVVYGEAASIRFGSQISEPPPPRKEEPIVKGREAPRPTEPPAETSLPSSYPEGAIAIPVTITNTGQVDELLDVHFQLSPAAGARSRSYYLQKGQSVADTLYFELAAGSYVLSATSNQPHASAQTAFTVVSKEAVTMTTTAGAQGADGLIPVTMNVANTGFNTLNGNIALAVMNNQGKAIWRGEASVASLAPQASQNYTITVDTAGMLSGAYKTDIVLYSASGQRLAVDEARIRVLGPIFEMTALPNYPTFTVGREAQLAFAVRNTGTLAGTATFSVKAMEVLNESGSGTFNPGEEKTFTFSFTVPEEAEEKDYLADYALVPVNSHASSGQVKFHVAAVDIGVIASLDKVSYGTGDTAALTLAVAKQAPFEDGEYIAIIRYGAFHDMKPIFLSDAPATVAFSVPLPVITGEPIFYSIHFPSGRTIYRNAIAVNRAQPDLVIGEISFSPESSHRYSLEAEIINSGDLPAGASAVVFYDGEPAPGQGVEIGRRNVPALASGAAIDVALDWEISGKAGAHAIYAVVDPDDVVIERSEANNTRFADLTIPDFILDVATIQPQYQANQEVGIVQTVANLTTGKTLDQALLVASLGDPAGNTVTTFDVPVPALASGMASYADSWNTASSMPGIYSLEAVLKQNAQVLASASAEFEVLPTISIQGTMATADTVVQGFPFALGYTLTNKGNIDLADGEVEAAFMEPESGAVAAAFTGEFGSLQVQTDLAESLDIERVTLEPGEYMLRLFARASGEEFLIGEKAVKVLPPLEVAIGAATVPRVLVLIDKVAEGAGGGIKGQETALRQTIIADALNSIGAYYRLVYDRDDFKRETRTGIYNTFILAGNEPLTDHLDEELGERVHSGDGLILLNYGYAEDAKFRELVGARAEGALPAGARTLVVFETPMTRAGTLAIAGKLEKLAATSPEALSAAAIDEKGNAWPGILVNPYGKGRVITFAFDPAQSAMAAGDPAAYASLLADALTHGAPKEAEAVPGAPFGLEIALKSIGQAFTLKVEQSLSAALPVLITEPRATASDAAMTWTVDLREQEIERLIYLVELPEQGDIHTSATDVYYLRGGSYEFYNRYPFALEVEGLADMETRILSGLATMSESTARKIVNDYQELLNRMLPNMQRHELDKLIYDVLAIIGQVRELKAGATDIRLDLDKLLKILERRWVEAGG